ncbi:MAG TPA: rhomboid family intramembrane serine protease [Cytophagales bacterium]|nr:rhomboid family intramembrane serine protease [Cytophagales bacterium]
MSSKSRLNHSLFFPLRFVVLLWLVYILELLLHMDLGLIFGIYPRQAFGIIGIFTSPLIHGNLMHLFSNSVPLLVLGSLLYFFYDRIAAVVFFNCYFLTGALVWIFARPFIHIGASGVIYGIAFFLLFIGIFRKDFLSVLISLGVAFFYGGMIWGVLPGIPGISWESHLIGAIVGVFTAFKYGNSNKISRY